MEFIMVYTFPHTPLQVVLYTYVRYNHLQCTSGSRTILYGSVMYMYIPGA